MDNNIYDKIDYTEINHPYFKIARDKVHDGFAFSDGISNIFLRRAIENNFFKN
jgi:hypothetical protein